MATLKTIITFFYIWKTPFFFFFVLRKSGTFSNAVKPLAQKLSVCRFIAALATPKCNLLLYHTVFPCSSCKDTCS